MIELTPIISDWPYDKALETYASLADQPYALFFDSARRQHPLSQWSFIAWAPIETIECKNGVITHNGKTTPQSDIFDFIQSRLDHYKVNISNNCNASFYGGAAGYLGYDLGRQLEVLPDDTIDDLNLPDCMIGIYTRVISFDHKNKVAQFIALKKDDEIIKPPSINKESNAISSNIIACWEEKTPQESYKNNIQKVINYIHAGEIYQANLSRRFDLELPKNFNAFDHYKSLRLINSAPFNAFMNFGSFQLASCSPERFMTLKNNKVETRPIKGTLPSSEDPQKLKDSKKDNAENLMIVDLLRNDISKVCQSHSVTVPTLCNIETFDGLHHMVSTIEGDLKADENATSLLKSCFPGGSITGAPKIRAMEIIEELEPTRRGPYCGAMGYIGFNGNMDTSIIIRTLIYKNQKAYLQTGSGIVSDSIPEQELQEGLDKAQKIFESYLPLSGEHAA